MALIARSDLNVLTDLIALNARSGTAGRKLIVLALKCLVSDSDTAVCGRIGIVLATIGREG